MTSVTVVVPMTIRRRGGRKQIIGPDGAAVQAGGDAAGVTETRGDPALVKALARAFRWRRMLESGKYASTRELAIAEGTDRTQVARALSLLLLAPDLVEAILEGEALAGLGASVLRDRIPACWQAQRRQFSATPPRT